MHLEKNYHQNGCQLFITVQNYLTLYTVMYTISVNILLKNIVHICAVYQKIKDHFSLSLHFW